MERRVVVTGIGAVSPIGIGKDAFREAMFSGTSGVAEISLFDASAFPSKLGAEVKDFDFKAALDGMDVLNITNDRRAHFANAASRLAIDDARIDEKSLNSTKCGVIFGSGIHIPVSKSDPIMFCDVKKTLSDAGSFNFNTYRDDVSGGAELSVIPANLGTVTVANHFKTKGLCYTVVSACAAASQAIGLGMRAIKRGELDFALTGGYDSMIFPFGVGGFCLLDAMTKKNDELTKAIKPFDKNRDGFALGEGAGVIALEELEHAKKRGAHIYAELIGFGSSEDAYRVTDPNPDGSGAALAIKNALNDARIGPGDVDYINAHGTATPKNDRMETKAIKTALGDHAYKTPVSSIKSMIGHLVSAAGAIEFIACVLAIENDCAPPTINHTIPDDECDLDYVPNKARNMDINIALSNSFGFGGQNSALLAKKFNN